MLTAGAEYVAAILSWVSSESSQRDVIVSDKENVSSHHVMSFNTWFCILQLYQACSQCRPMAFDASQCPYNVCAEVCLHARLAEPGT